MKDWKKKQDLIIHYYVTEGKTCEDVKKLMAEDHKFIASVRSYRQRFKEWGVTKYKRKGRRDSHHSNPPESRSRTPTPQSFETVPNSPNRYVPYSVQQIPVRESQPWNSACDAALFGSQQMPSQRNYNDESLQQIHPRMQPYPQYAPQIYFGNSPDACINQSFPNEAPEAENGMYLSPAAYLKVEDGHVENAGTQRLPREPRHGQRSNWLQLDLSSQRIFDQQLKRFNE